MSDEGATAAERCEECGDPLESPGDRGANADGSRSARFCRLCYQDGQFVESLPGRGDALSPR